MKKLNILLLLLLPLNYLLCRTFYIDSENGKNSNTGLSIDNPWQSFSNIRNTTFSAGDSILLKRGSKWNETLFISFVGDKNNPIIISSYLKGEQPVIDLEGKSNNGIFIRNSKNIIVDGLHILNPGKDNSGIKVVSSENCIVRNCKIFNTGRAGIFVEKSIKCTFHSNNIYAPSEFLPDQTDGIYGQRNTGNIYDGNNIVDKNLNPDEHSDCIQLYRETDAIVKNNYIEQDNNKTANAQGIYCTVSFGNHYYYNNIIFAPQTKAQLLGFFNLKEGNGKLFAFNNTIDGGFMNSFRTDDTRPVVKNNIIITRGNYSMVRFDSPLDNSADINNNIYFTKYPKPVFYVNDELTFAEWKSLGKESEGFNVDPQLTKEYKPIPGSPCINAGVDLSLIFHDDKSGVTRTKKKKYDIGAYEYREN